MAWGRVALLLAATETNKQHLDELAQVLDYVSQPEEKPTKQPKGLETGSTEIPEVGDKKTIKDDRPKMIFWQITKITALQPVDNSPVPYLQDRQIAASYNMDKKGSYLFESPKPLATLTQLSPLLINSLGRQVTGRQLDYRQTIRRLSRGKSINKLAYYSHQKWPLTLTILIDKHSELYPYWLDFETIAQQIQSQLGKTQVQVINLHERNLHEFAAKQYAMAPSVLILSDLNHYANSHRYWAWQDILQRIKKQATEILTLSPATQTVNQEKDYKLCNMTSLQPTQGFIRQLKKHPYKNPVSAAQIERALTMISPLALADTGLIRKLRLYFHWGNAALEGEIWNDKRIVQNVIGIRLQDFEQKKYHQQFITLNSETKKAYWALVNSHQQAAYQGLSFLNAISEASLTEEKEPDNANLVEKIQALLAYGYQTHSKTVRQKINQQLATLVHFVPQQAWESNELSPLLHYSYALAYQDEIKQGQWSEKLPAGCQLGQLPQLDEGIAIETTQAYQFKMQGLAGKAVFEPIANEQAIHYCRLTTTRHHPAVWQYADQEQQHPLKNGDRVALLENQNLIIKSLDKQWQIKAISCPDFAKKIGQDQHGLFIETQLNQTNKRYYWLPEQRDEKGKTLAGVWFPQYMDISKVIRDEYGVYRNVNIKQISQRFRYIPPGNFLMGSPENEAERELWGAKENQHPVTLTSGFWLADTTVTQALYQQVMGKNPSHFKGGLNLPVDSVSWGDAQQFIEKINQLIPEIKAQLPTEAQWEYACRADTETPFSFGNNMSPEQVNYNGKHPYLEAKKGLNRAKTVAVKSLPENQWGLYEMHGNVWEWCNDVYQEDLGVDAVVDPKGEGMSVIRVVRGGSWGGDGRNVRSAIRFRDRPDSRDHSLGFRLSLGLELKSSKEQLVNHQSHSRRDVAKETDGGQDAAG